MKRIVFLVSLSVIIFLAAASCTSQAAKNLDYTEPGNVAKLIAGKDNYFLLDVRTPEEFAAGYIPTALNTPISDIPKNLPAINKEDLIVLYCRSGNRSALAYKMLMDMGYTNMFDFGGINRWTGELLRTDTP